MVQPKKEKTRDLDITPKKMHRWQREADENILNIICHYGISNLNNITTYLLEWLKSKNLTISCVTEDMEQQELPFIADKNVK